MSTFHEWIPEKKEESSGKPSRVTYIFVPRINVGNDARLKTYNLAGWGDPHQNFYKCKTCNKKVPISFLGLAIYPMVKSNIDLLEFWYEVAQHKSGGTFSKDMCKESKTRVSSQRESITSVKVRDIEKKHSENETPPKEQKVDEDDIKKKVAALPPQLAEERYRVLSSKAINEMTSEEYAERLALFARLTGNWHG